MTITAKVIADSISKSNKRIITFELEYPRFVHAEFMTHRLFSRNAASSRAIPVRRAMELIKEDTAMPIHWGKNQPGMSAKEECTAKLYNEDDFYPSDADLGVTREAAWNYARNSAIDYAREFDRAGYHKQIVNRLLEPFTHIKVVCTATEYDNFFWLRKHKDAQPEIQRLAEVMYERMERSTPITLTEGSWHVPYYGVESVWIPVTDNISDVFIDESTLVDKHGFTLADALSISSSCAAQISYRRLDSSVEKGRDIYSRLIESFPPHFSPFEHQATPMNEQLDWPHGATHKDKGGDFWSGNFNGWVQHRQILMETLDMQPMTSKYIGDR